MMLACWRCIFGFRFFRRKELEAYRGLFLLEDKTKEKREGSIYQQLIAGPLKNKREREAAEEADTVQAITHFLEFLKTLETDAPASVFELPSIPRCKCWLRWPIPRDKIENSSPSKRQRLAFWEHKRLWDYNGERFSESYYTREKLLDYIRENS